MSEHARKLRATLAELEDELRSLPSVDEETRAVLEEAAEEIQSALRTEQPTPLRRQSLMDRLTTTAKQFEGSHPNLTGILSRLVDGLGQMGI
jgi:hypothetical protein